MCETNAGNVCGCESESECGDAGLTCLKPGTPQSFCGLSCASPEAPPCPGAAQGCDANSGLCQVCTADEQCQTGTQTAGPRCGAVIGESGICGCFFDSDCRAGRSCFVSLGDPLGSCQIPLPRCTPESCNGNFCDWDSGSCLPTTSPPPCITDYDCGSFYSSGGDFCLAGSCVRCLDDNDCVLASASSNGQNTMCCLPGDSSCDSASPSEIHSCVWACHTDADCIGNVNGPACVLYGDAGYGACVACASGADCAGNPNGSHCDLDGGPGWTFTCSCLTAADCGLGLSCYHAGYDSFCTSYCSGGADCPPGYFCDPGKTCRPRCDNGGPCQGPDPICDLNDAGGQNGETLDGSVPGLVWCYGCLTGNDCPSGQTCSYSHVCGPCQIDSQCASGACVNGTCLSACDGGACPSGQVCDTDGFFYGRGFCYQCLSPIDCPDGQGCNSMTHTCGSCMGPTFYGVANGDGGPFDCPPGDVCSNYWTPGLEGACLQTCDTRGCPADHPICAVLPALTPDHKLCFGCLQDSDCADAGPNAWCDTSVYRTFTCQLPVTQQ